MTEPDAARPDPGNRAAARYFHPEWGLMAYRAAGAVEQEGPLAYGTDGQFWAYADGLWSPGEAIVHARICRALRDRYRPSHGEAVRHVLRAELAPLVIRAGGGYLNMSNGMLRWDADPEPLLHEHHPEYESTVQLPIEWNPDARCPLFEAFLAESVAPDDRARVWEILGYLMMSGNPLQKLFLFSGGGGNGKGVLLHVIKELLGASNVSSVPLHEFAESQFASAEVFGMLANICGDIDTTYIEKTGRIKELSGEDRIKGERKYGKPFYFDFWGKALFSANALPAAADPSTGWLRRWEIVSFPFEPARPDPTLKRRLSDPGELQGIAVLAVAALRALMVRRRFDRGESAMLVHEEFAQRSNKVLAWVTECAYADPSSWYERSTLLRAFRMWDAHENPGGRAMGSQTFYERLRNVRGVRDAKRQGTRGFAGLRLTTDAILIDMSESESAPSGGGSSDFSAETMF